MKDEFSVRRQIYLRPVLPQVYFRNVHHLNIILINLTLAFSPCNDQSLLFVEGCLEKMRTFILQKLKYLKQLPECIFV